jgi:hypothetical protein
LPYLGAFLIFCRYKMQEIDKNFAVVFLASALVVVVENIFTIDQFSLFCAINLIFMARILLIIYRNNFLNFSENLFFLGFFLIIPLSQQNSIRMIVFGFSGVFNLWWVMLIYSFIMLYKKLDLESRRKIFTVKKITVFLIIYFVSFSLMVKAFSGLNYWLSNFVALVFFITFYFVCEKYFFSKIGKKLTQFAVFMIMASLFLYIHDYSDNFRNMLSESGYRNKFRKIYDFKVYYYKTKAPNPSDNELNFYSLHQLSHPIVNYFNKDMPQKISIFGINSISSYQRMLFSIRDPEVNFVYDYIIRDAKKMFKDNQTKLIFVDNYKINEDTLTKCVVGYIEYLFFDKEIKNYFLKNYKFENRLIIVEKKEIKDDIYSWFSKDENFDENSKYQLKGSVRKILSDIEVYVRKN